MKKFKEELHDWLKMLITASISALYPWVVLIQTVAILGIYYPGLWFFKGKVALRIKPSPLEVVARLLTSPWDSLFMDIFDKNLPQPSPEKLLFKHANIVFSGLYWAVTSYTLQLFVQSVGYTI